MLRFHRKSKGFTLIELMIVVAIIGILAAIAIPRFANLIDRAREARTQGNLGAIRSAMAIHYGATDGTWPATILAMTPIYIDAVPSVLLPAAMGHLETTNEVAVAVPDGGTWFYNAAAAIGGVVNVDCTHIDSGGVNAVNTW
ncbi:MAG: type II secretion system GspH family protein [Elusimicrobiota bacterium]|nr:type II secretion system GspH family protein [Elusimicrobiota bacterium]